MIHFARVINGRVTEVWNDGGLNVTPADVFVAELASQFVQCPAWVQSGATKIGDTWQNPAPIEKVEEE